MDKVQEIIYYLAWMTNSEWRKLHSHPTVDEDAVETFMLIVDEATK